eukprot:Hpha_TRINITY_DN16082_c2_g2::TRINITY_DN16082_c2_g2_i1::g.120160::m.120160
MCEGPCIKANAGHAVGGLVSSIIAAFVCGTFASGSSFVTLRKDSILTAVFEPNATGPNLPFPGRGLGYEYGIGVYQDTNMQTWHDTAHPATMLGCEDLKQHGQGMIGVFALAVFFLLFASLGHVMSWSGCWSAATWLSGLGHLLMSLSLLAGFGLALMTYYNDWECNVPNESVGLFTRTGLRAAMTAPLAVRDGEGSHVQLTLSLHEHFDLNYGLGFIIVSCVFTLVAGLMVFCCGCGCCSDREEEK